MEWVGSGTPSVSTSDQDLALQIDALTQAGCERIFEETAAERSTHAQSLNALLDHLREDDVLVVWRLDRLGRSLRHLIEVVGELDERGVALHSISEGLDTSTAGGRLVFHVFGALAEFERELIRERTVAGLAAARARGRKGGRPKVMTAEKLEVAREMYASKRFTLAAIATTLGVSRATVYRSLKAEV